MGWRRVLFVLGFALAAIPFVWWFQYTSNDPFFLAIESGNRTKVIWMLRFNPWLIHARDRGGLSPLAAASNAGQGAIVAVLLQKETDAEIERDYKPVIEGVSRRLEIWDKKFMNALQGDFYLGERADKIEPIEISEELIPSGRTPLHVAAARGDNEIIEHLLAQGARVNAKDDDGYTPLHDAAMLGRTETVSLLIAHGADLTVRTKDRLRHSFSKGVSCGCQDRSAGNRPSLSRRDGIGYLIGNGNTPLHCALIGDHPETIKCLITHGADVNAKTEEGKTLLELAVVFEDEELISMLAAGGADVKARDEFGSTLLHQAAHQGIVPVMKMIVAKGADVNARDKNLITPLNEAIFEGHKEAVKVLLELGADINARDSFGRTALRYAVEYKHAEIAEMLRQAGAKE